MKKATSSLLKSVKNGCPYMEKTWQFKLWETLNLEQEGAGRFGYSDNEILSTVAWIAFSFRLRIETKTGYLYKDEQTILIKTEKELNKILTHYGDQYRWHFNVAANVNITPIFKVMIKHKNGTCTSKRGELQPVLDYFGITHFDSEGKQYLFTNKIKKSTKTVYKDRLRISFGDIQSVIQQVNRDTLYQHYLNDASKSKRKHLWNKYNFDQVELKSIREKYVAEFIRRVGLSRSQTKYSSVFLFYVTGNSDMFETKKECTEYRDFVDIFYKLIDDLNIPVRRQKG